MEFLTVPRRVFRDDRIVGKEFILVPGRAVVAASRARRRNRRVGRVRRRVNFRFERAIRNGRRAGAALGTRRRPFVLVSRSAVDGDIVFVIFRQILMRNRRLELTRLESDVVKKTVFFLFRLIFEMKKLFFYF